MPETCCACLAVMTAIEREYIVEGMCAECAELAHELSYFARRPVWYGEAPMEPGEVVHEQQPSARAVSGLPGLRVGPSLDRPASPGPWYYWLALAVAAAVFLWRWA